MAMARSKLASPCSSLLLVAVLLSQNMAVIVMSTSFEDQKNYYPPDPHAGSGSPPTGSGSPPTGSGSPPTGSGSPPTGSGSHGGHHHGAPPSNCGNPPVDPGTPSTPSPHIPTPSHNPSPSTPSHNPSPSTPSHNPTPSVPGGGGIPLTPTTPGIPGITPTPPFLPTNPLPGTCYYWLTHPTLIWGVVGWWGTVGSVFGLPHSVPGVLPSLTVQQALSNTRTDGIGALYREGTASMLNSMVNNKFPFTTEQVRNSFVAALSSNNAAATQARVFKLANEGRLKPRA